MVWLRKRSEIRRADSDNRGVGLWAIKAHIKSDEIGFGVGEDFDAIAAAKAEVEMALQY